MTPAEQPGYWNRRTPGAQVVGNDVVDLTAPRARGRALQPRFLERVFDAEERGRILAASDPDLELWHAWGAKEAAYKVISKMLDVPPVFAHREFVVRWDASAGTRAGRKPTEAPRPPRDEVDVRAGRVTWRDRRVPFRAMLRMDGQALEVVASPEGPGGCASTVEFLDRPGAPWNAPLEALRARLAERELDAVHSRPSAAVRLGARLAAASLLGVPSRRLAIVCRPGPLGRRPPVLLLDDAPAPLDVSLSHDGPWIAWALLRRSPGRRSGPEGEPRTPNAHLPDPGDPSR